MEIEMVKLHIADNKNSLTLKVFPKVAEQYSKSDTKGLSTFEKLSVINQITEFFKSKETNISIKDNYSLDGKSIVESKECIEKKSKSIRRLDPETNKLALEITEILFKEGVIKFPDYTARMIEALGERIKPYVKGFYEYSRAFYIELKMTDSIEVAMFDIDNFKVKKIDIIKLQKTE